MRTITLIPGDGIGPEITDSVIKIIEKCGVKVNWDVQTAGLEVAEKEGSPLPERVITSIKKNKVALKAPVTTPIGGGFVSVNVSLRKQLDLYAGVRLCQNIPFINTKFDNVNIAVIRENTQDLYAGIERRINSDTVEGVKLITREASERIAKFAFEYAINNNRKEVCAVSKANICKQSDGLFLESVRKISDDYHGITYKEILVDNLCMQLVLTPEKFDVLVLPNLYGDIVSDLCAGLIGGLGVAKGVNYGEKYAIFEPVHGAAPDIANKGIANPTALLLSAIDMLTFIEENSFAQKIYQALIKTLKQGIKTRDIGGDATCNEFTDKIISNIQ